MPTVWNSRQSKHLGKLVRREKVCKKFPPEYSPTLQQPVTQGCLFAANSSYRLLFNEFLIPFWPHVNPSYYTFPLLRPTAEPCIGGGPSLPTAFPPHVSVSCGAASLSHRHFFAMNPSIVQFTEGSKFREKRCQIARHCANFRCGSAGKEETYSLKPSFRETTEISGLDKPIKRTIKIIFLWIFIYY